ncbi:cupredoxin domain-containing protein [Candidatus Woesearchaeota archaeon]|nr:cupredoxin domain-containing protein [Candidatus Woesearchaeota archaeon]
MQYLSYLMMYVLYFAVIIIVSVYVYKSRKIIDEMHGMMIGMTLGMLTGLITATLFLIPTGNFLYGVIIGSIVGLLFGIPFGKLGGHLGIMEGIIAGPMGGMMGAMLGQMVRPFSIEIFIPFFTLVFLLTVVGITYAVNCRLNIHNGGEHTQQHRNDILPRKLLLLWSFITLFLLIASIVLPFSLEPNKKTSPSVTDLLAKTSEKDNNTGQLPSYLQELMKEERQEAIIRGDYQEIDLRIGASKYSPNVIVAIKGIPLKINLYADENAGCTREIVFPDFNVDKIVPAGGKESIEIMPQEAGEFPFRCSMDMVRGKLIIQ